MFKKQWDRTKKNIGAFLWLGLIAGVLFGIAGELSSSPIVQSLLSSGDLNIDFKALANTVLTENIAPVTLLFLWVAVLVFAAAHRVIYGAIHTRSLLSIGFIEPLEELGSLLAVAWLGLQLGLLAPVAYYVRPAAAVPWLFLCIYPLAYLGEMSVFMKIISQAWFFPEPDWAEEKRRWRWSTRLEGLLILVGAVGFLLFQRLLNAELDAATAWLIRHLKVF